MTDTFSIYRLYAILSYNRTKNAANRKFLGEKLSFSAITKFCRCGARRHSKIWQCNFDISKPLIRIPMHLNECQKQKPIDVCITLCAMACTNKDGKIHCHRRTHARTQTHTLIYSSPHKRIYITTIKTLRHIRFFLIFCVAFGRD